VEIEANGHTYRRRRDGNGWCRFSPKPEECGVQESDLPDNVQAQARQIDDDAVAEAQRLTGKQQAAANDWPEDPPDGYEWYAGPDGMPRVRNKPGNDGPLLEYDPQGDSFVQRPRTRPKPDVKPVEGETRRVLHSELEAEDVSRLEGRRAERTAAQGRKRSAKAAGDEQARSTAHGEMVSASEQLGEEATDIVARRQLRNPERLEAELPGGQKTGEFDRIYRDGDDVYIYESKGAGARRGNRQTSEGIRAEQGTPQYRDDIIDNMEQSVRRHMDSERYRTDPQFKERIDRLRTTVRELENARRRGKLHYAQVNQKVDRHGNLRPEIEVTPFDPNQSVRVEAD
jgi:hypothetical protein